MNHEISIPMDVRLAFVVPMEVRLALVFVLGACLASLANWCIYRLAWHPRPVSPWSARHPNAPPRRLWDRFPILGWFGLRREAKVHGAGFWIRPLVLELLGGIGLAALYGWEIGGGLLPAEARGALHADLLAMLHLEFAAHAILLTLMLAASMIDVDEMIIPDAITVPGTLIGLLFATAWPRSLLPWPIFGFGPLGIPKVDAVRFLQLASPNEWPQILDGAPLISSLCLGLACWWLWCVAILPRTWYPRHGWRRALRLSTARVARERNTYRILRMAVFGAVLIAIVWFRGDQGWQGLLTALVGMAAGGGLLWLVRVFCFVALGREAMGFGDVTLMAMIGAFLGWQATLIIFFLAPLAGLVVGVLRVILFRDREIPYGPFLCLASLFLIVQWDAVWERTEPLFAFGWVVPVLMLACPPAMAIMLGFWRLILAVVRR